MKNKFCLYSHGKEIQLNSVQFSRSVVSDSLRPHEPQHTRPPCPSPVPGVYSDSCPLSRWCHPFISFSVVPFSSCPQSLPGSGSFPVSQLFTSGGQNTGVSASACMKHVLPMNTQDWSPLGWTGWISLQSKGLSRVFSNTTAQKHQFFSAQLSSQSNSHIHTWPLEHNSISKKNESNSARISDFSLPGLLLSSHHTIGVKSVYSTEQATHIVGEEEVTYFSRFFGWP